MTELGKRLRREAPLALFYLAVLAAAITLSIYTHREKVGWAEGYLVWLVPTFLGVLAGQVAFLLRVRTWVVLAAAVSWFVAAYNLFPYLVQQDWFPGKQPHPLFVDGVGLTFMWYLALWAPLFSLGGLFSLRRPWGVLACWFPTVFFIKATIPYINLDQEWLEGRKWTVWTPGTLLVVVCCVALFLFFLAWRERRRISQWSQGRGSWKLQGGGRTVWRRAIEVSLLVLLLSAGTALISPFLWNRVRNAKGTEIRGGSAQNRGDEPGQDQEGASDRSGEPGAGEGQSPRQDPVPDPGQQVPPGGDPQEPPPTGQVNAGSEEADARDRPAPTGDSDEAGPGEEAGQPSPSGADEAGGEGGSSGGGGGASGAAQRLLPWLLLILLWALLRRPVERLRLVRSWLDPHSRHSPTERIENAWRAVRVVLEDYGRSPQPAETPEAFCRRLYKSWPSLAGPLEAAAGVATIRDRVFFSLFVQPGDVEESRRLAAGAYRALWDGQSAWQKLRSLYRDLAAIRA